jgi:hypothetical protein
MSRCRGIAQGQVDEGRGLFPGAITLHWVLSRFPGRNTLSSGIFEGRAHFHADEQPILQLIERGKPSYNCRPRRVGIGGLRLV